MEQKRKARLLQQKESEAYKMINELMNERYSRLPPKEYFNEALDFYGQTLRLSLKEQE